MKKMILTLACTAFTLFGDTLGERREEAIKYLQETKLEARLSSGINDAVQLLIDQLPNLEYKTAEFQAFFKKFMSYECMEDELVEALASEFTLEELKELNAKALLELDPENILILPFLMEKVEEISEKKSETYMPELYEILGA